VITDELITSMSTGVLSSLLAVALVEIYHFGRRRMTMRPLKGVLQLHSTACTIVASIVEFPELPAHWRGKLMHYRDAYSFGHLFNMCQRIGVHADLAPHDKTPDFQEWSDVFCVGGPVFNAATAFYLGRYLPGVRLEAGNAAAGMLQGGGFRIGNDLLANAEGEHYAILVKLTDRDLLQDRTVHLLFGYNAIGTAAAAYYLWKHHRDIYRLKGQERYCIVVRLTTREGYRSVRRDFEDYTSVAFSGSSRGVNE
jgi:hypothetical protein